MANDSLRRAIEIAGGQKPLADSIGTTQSQVWYWLEKSKKGVPAQYCIRIEEKTGIARHLLRPDVFPEPRVAEQSA
jgi:DNA-binding transcriptional regulator YdaS (Cro superfamily)